MLIFVRMVPATATPSFLTGSSWPWTCIAPQTQKLSSRLMLLFTTRHAVAFPMASRSSSTSAHLSPDTKPLFVQGYGTPAWWGGQGVPAIAGPATAKTARKRATRRCLIGFPQTHQRDSAGAVEQSIARRARAFLDSG